MGSSAQGKPSAIALISLALVAAGARWAGAEEVYAVVAEPGCDRARAEAVFSALTERGYDVVRFRLQAAPPPPGDRAAASAVAEVRSAVSKARADYVQVSLDPAIERLERAEADHLVGLLASADGVAALVDLNLWLGNLFVAAGRSEDAELRFALALALSPQVEIDRAVFPPEVTAVFDAVKRRGAGARGSLTIETRPAGAEVEVDARVAPDRSPATVDAAAGWHYVRVRLPGFRAWAQRVRLAAGEVKALPVALGPAATEQVSADIAAVMTDVYGEDPRRAIRLIAGAAAADRVVVVGAETVRLCAANGRTLARASGADARAAAESLFVEAAPPGGDRRAPVYKRWWFWTAAGAVAIATGAAIFAVTQEDTLRGRFGPTP